MREIYDDLKYIIIMHSGICDKLDDDHIKYIAEELKKKNWVFKYD